MTPQTPVTLTYTTPQGTRFEEVVAVDADYLFTVTQRVTNPHAVPLTLRPWGLVSHLGEGTEKDAGNLHVGPIGVVGERLKDSEVAYKKLRDDGAQSFATTGGWLGITDKYWATALIPDQHTPVTARFALAPGDRFQTDYLQPAVSVAPGATVATTAHLFAGAKEVNLIGRYKDALGIPLFDRIVSWGWFWFIAEPIFLLLDFLFHLFGNFGLAIMGLTFLIRLAMFPIAAKQFQSMNKMKLVQPKLKELQERYKDDKPQLQQETMALYKKEKVNPVAGCLPVVPADPDLLRALQDAAGVDRDAPPAVRRMDQGPVGRRPADPGQPVRPAALHPAGDDRHRPAADPARRVDVGAAEAQSGPGRSGRRSRSSR